jgi:hypothetical protein
MKDTNGFKRILRVSESSMSSFKNFLPRCTRLMWNSNTERIIALRYLLRRTASKQNLNV